MAHLEVTIQKASFTKQGFISNSSGRGIVTIPDYQVAFSLQTVRYEMKLATLFRIVTM